MELSPEQYTYIKLLRLNGFGYAALYYFQNPQHIPHPRYLPEVITLWQNYPSCMDKYPKRGSVKLYA